MVNRQVTTTTGTVLEESTVEEFNSSLQGEFRDTCEKSPQVVELNNHAGFEEEKFRAFQHYIAQRGNQVS